METWKSWDSSGKKGAEGEFSTKTEEGFGVSVRGLEDLKQECLKLMSTLGFTRL